jgi:hypothetical protein
MLLPAGVSAQQRKSPTIRGPYGWQVMTDEEKVEYSETLDGLSTPESRAAFRVDHREKMKARAREQGVDLSTGSNRGADGRRPGNRGGRSGKAAPHGASHRAPVGWELMSEQERVAYKDTLQQLETREERTAFREEHREKMEARADDEGIVLRASRKPPIYGQQLMSEEEKNTFLATASSLKTPKARNEFRAAHVAEMQRRAKEQGVALPPPPTGRRPAKAAASGTQAVGEGG